MFRADLHCHSCYSDGTDTPQILIERALQLGLTGISITDHDTIAAYAEAIPYAQEKGLKLLTGVEFSASYQDVSIHILGYGFSLNSTEIQHLCAHHMTRREKRNRIIVDNLTKLGYPCSYQELAQMGHRHTLGRPHIALLLMQKGVVHSLKEAFDRFLGEGKAAFYPGEPVSVEETIRVIHAGGGKALIAHPHLIKQQKILRYLLTLPFDGMEVYYAGLPRDQEEKWLQIVLKRGWVLSGGSDYHGSVKPMNRLGSSWVDEAAFEALSS